VSIHPSAIVAAGARIPESSTIGPYCTIGPEVELGEECTLISHVVIDGRTRIGARNTFYPFCSIGVAPQDLKYKGEPTETILGDGNTIRECVTISRGTTGGGGLTRLGDGNLLMAYAHVGHDSQVGSRCILANSATLAGHVTIEDDVTLGALSARTPLSAAAPSSHKMSCPFRSPRQSVRTGPSALTKSASSARAFRPSACSVCRRRIAICWPPGSTPPRRSKKCARSKATTWRCWCGSSSAASAG